MSKGIFVDFNLLGNAYKNTLVRLVSASARAALWMTLAAALLTGALLYYTASNLSMNTDTADMLAPELPFRQLAKQFERTFPQYNHLIVIVIEGDARERVEHAADALAAKLKSMPEQFQSVYQPGHGPYFARHGLLYLNEDELWELSDRLAEAQPFLGALAQDPSLRGLFGVLNRALTEELSAENEVVLSKMLTRISATLDAQFAGQARRLSWQEDLLGGGMAAGNPHRAFLLAQPRVDYSHLQPGAEAIELTRAFIRELNLDAAHGVRVRLTGSVAMDYEELSSVAQGAGIATALSFGLVCLILMLGLRSPRIVIAILVTLVAGLIWTAAFATVALGQLNLISVTFAVLFIGLGVDFGIQFGMRYKEELDGGQDHADALESAAAGVGGALTLAALAAAISFFSFAPTDYRGLAELGIIAGVSMFIALLANLTLLPALLTLMPMRLEARKPQAGLIARLQFPVRRHRRSILISAALLAIGSAALLPQVRFDFNPLNLKDPNTESVAAFLDLFRDPLTTPYTLQVLAPNLAAAQGIAARLDKLAVVDKTLTLASYVPGAQAEKLAIIQDMALLMQPIMTPAEHVRPPTQKEEIAALNSFLGTLRASIKTGSSSEFAKSAARLAEQLEQLKTTSGGAEQNLADFKANILGYLPQTLDRLRNLMTPGAVDLKQLPADLQQRYIAPDGRARIEIFPKQNISDNQAMRRFVRDVQGIAPEVSGAPVTLVASGDAVIKACLQATGLALCAAIILLLVVLRSVWLTLLVLLPLILAAELTAASSVLLNIPFNFANVIALPLLLGIGIAFGIYLVMRQRDGRAIDTLFHSSTPRAVLFSALTTIASFGVLALSDHRGMSSMGLLLTLALSFALLCTLVILPAIMAVSENMNSSAERA